jgi:hypothetical protein
VTQEPAPWPNESAEPTSSGPAEPAYGAAPSGPVSPWSRPGHLPPVEPTPAPVLLPGVPAGAVPTAPLAPTTAPSEAAGWGRAAAFVPAHGPARFAPPGYGAAGQGAVAVPPVPPPPPEGRWHPERVEAVPGTGFGVVHFKVAPLMSGFAVGSLIAGIAAILLSFVVLTLGLWGVSGGWGAWVAGAFTVPGGLAGLAGIALGLVAMSQIRRSGQPGRIRFTGRGIAVSGVVCGAAGLGISLLALALILLLQLG